MNLIIVLSLAGNFAVLDVLIGHSLRESEQIGRGARAVNWIIGLVPEQRREFAMAHFAEARDRIEAAYEARAREIEPVLAAIRAEPYERAALDSALDDMLDRRSAGRAIVRERLVSLVAEFTPAERAAFAERLAERLEDRSEEGGRRRLTQSRAEAGCSSRVGRRCATGGFCFWDAPRESPACAAYSRSLIPSMADREIATL